MERLADFLASRSRILAVLVLASAILPALHVPGLRIDNSIEVWVRREGEALSRYREFLRRFGSDEFVVVALDMDEPFSEEGLAVQRDLASSLHRVRGVEDVQSLAELHDVIWAGNADWETEARRSPLVRDLLVGADGRTVGLLVQLGELVGPRARRRAVEEIEKITGRLRGSGITPHLAGTPVMNVTLDRSAEKAAATFMPVAVGIGIVVLGLVLRKVTAVIAVLLAVGTAVLWTMGLLEMTGHTLNMVLVALPTLLFVLGLSGGIHIASRHISLVDRTGQPRQALARALRELIRPTVFSGLTTAVGFGSLMVAEMAPVADLGLFAAAGLVSSLLCNLTVLPGVLSLFSRRGGRDRLPHLYWIGSVGTAAACRPVPFLGAGLLLAVLCTAGMMRLRTEADVLAFFPETARITRDYQFVAKRLTGLYTLELVVHAPPSSEARVLDALRALDEDVSAYPEVARTIHLGQLELPSGSLRGGKDLATRLARGSRLIERFSRRFRSVEERPAPDGGSAAASGEVYLRMAVLIREMASSEFYRLLDRIRSRTGDRLGGLATWEVTGIVSLLNDAQKALVETQVRSFGVAAGVVLLMTGFLFRSLRAVLAALLPNLLPVLSTFALMGFSGMPLDPATVMIASLAIGIAVDDTIHFLGRYRLERATGLDAIQAARGALDEAGAPMLFTTLVAAVGFSILCLTDFLPIAHFGLLTAFTMVAAWMADVLLLPPSLSLVRLWETPTDRKEGP